MYGSSDDLIEIEGDVRVGQVDEGTPLLPMTVQTAPSGYSAQVFVSDVQMVVREAVDA